jgi:hypothetical protein
MSSTISRSGVEVFFHPGPNLTSRPPSGSLDTAALQKLGDRGVHQVIGLINAIQSTGAATNQISSSRRLTSASSPTWRFARR